MNIPRLCPGDLLELKKQHPCGAKQFRVVRVAACIIVVCYDKS